VVLVDTSVWIEHLRRTRAELVRLLTEGSVLSHGAVVGELACGTLRQRAAILELLRALPRADPASDDEALSLIESHRLSGHGLGWVDVHLLASARLSGCRLWTIDQQLARAAHRLGCGFRDG
jgi:predicted nucleic acid-binding protein